jgi:hypothetical protein
MANNDDQTQFLMFTGIGAVGMGAIIAIVYLVGFSSGGGGSSQPVAETVAKSATSNTPSGASGSSIPANSDNPIVRSQMAARSIETRNNLKQVAMAVHNYQDVFGNFPMDKNGLSWRVQVLPFLERNNLFRKFNPDEPWDSPQNKTLLNTMPDVFKTPGVDGSNTGVVRFMGPGAFLPDQETRMRNITDGTSNTILCTVVNNSAAVPWTKAADYNYNVQDPGASMLVMNDRYLVVMVDGAVRALNASIDLKTLQNSITHSDGQVVILR